MVAQHTAKAFDADLEELQRKVSEMGGIAEKGIADSVAALARRDGETFALLLTIHPISRFLLEQIRIDEPGMFGTSLSISQHISILLLAAAAGLWIYVERRPPGFAWPAKPQPAA